MYNNIVVSSIDVTPPGMNGEGARLYKIIQDLLLIETHKWELYREIYQDKLYQLMAYRNMRQFLIKEIGLSRSYAGHIIASLNAENDLLQEIGVQFESEGAARVFRIEVRMLHKFEQEIIMNMAKAIARDNAVSGDDLLKAIGSLNDIMAETAMSERITQSNGEQVPLSGESLAGGLQVELEESARASKAARWNYRTAYLGKNPQEDVIIRRWHDIPEDINGKIELSWRPVNG